MAQFLVTGGAGFIGSHLVDHLLSIGHRVRIIDNLTSGTLNNISKDAEFLQADIRSKVELSEAFHGVDGCFHLAAIASVQKSIEAPRETSDVNIMGTVAVFEEACRMGVPVVYASSAAIYGANDNLPLEESTIPQPLSPYAADKLSNEMLARALGASRRWPSFGLRFFNVYGPRQNPHSPYSGVVSIFLQRSIEGRDLIIYGDGSQSRDFIHVADVARFLAAAMEKADASAPITNVCTEQSTSVAELAYMLVERFGGRIVHEPSRLGDIRRSLGSPKLARERLGVAAHIAFREGLMTLT